MEDQNNQVRQPQNQNPGLTPQPQMPQQPVPPQTPQHQSAGSYTNSNLPSSKPGWMKYAMLATVLIVGFVAGIVFQKFVLDKPSRIEKLIEANYRVEYGDNYKEQIEKDLQEAESQPGSVEERAADTERTTDLNALHAQLEAYRADGDTYPTDNQLKDSAWVKTNLPGLDEQALIDPNGGKLGQDGAGYTYKAGNCNSNGCKSYELKTTLEVDGSEYTKENLFGIDE